MRRTALRAAAGLLMGCQAILAQTPAAGPTPFITLQDALQRARTLQVGYLGAVTSSKLAHEDRVQARAALLPSLSYNNQFLYTQGNGTGFGRYIANNGVHEYVSQGNAHQTVNLGVGEFADYRRTGAAEALARARQEIALRGLQVTVVNSFYGLLAAQHKQDSVQKAFDEANHFLDLSRKLENGGEVAHSDVIKAQLQASDRQRDLRESQLALETERLTLAVLLFPAFNEDFALVDDLHEPTELAPFPQMEERAAKNNADVRAAVAAQNAARHEVSVARGAHFPTLTLDYFYGIDAAQLATRTNGLRNLGYAATATLNIPVWNWGAIQSKVKQAELQQHQAQVELSAAQREALAHLKAFYAEADTAHQQLETLQASQDLAAESLRLTTLRYQSGEATALEVVDAQNTLVQSRNSYDDGAVRYRVALANLQTLTGSF